MDDHELQHPLDEREIRRRLLDYCRGIDRLDPALVASVYHPDGTDDHGVFVGLGLAFPAGSFAEGSRDRTDPVYEWTVGVATARTSPPAAAGGAAP